MAIDEIVLPETKPETEWILGRPVQKMSPTRDHSRLQMVFGRALDSWADGRGEVGPEWRFRVAPAGEIRRPLVPDLAYVSNERLRGFSIEDIQVPPFAPDVAVEILSPDDKPRYVRSKIATYLAAGSQLVVVVDPRRRSITLHDGTEPVVLTGSDAFEHPALPGFRIVLAALFARALDVVRQDTSPESASSS